MLKAEKTEVLSLFPSYVWKSELTPEASASINRDIRSRLAELMGGELRIRDGYSYQSTQDLYTYPEFAQFRRLIEGAVSGVLDFLEVRADNAMVTGCWANVNGIGASHRAHTHPNNFLSGVYYVKTSSGADRITFDDPRAQSFVIYPRFTEATVENGTEINLTVCEGTLLLFPAWLQHRVGPNNSTSERISISFNAMIPLPPPEDVPASVEVARIRD